MGRFGTVLDGGRLFGVVLPKLTGASSGLKSREFGVWSAGLFPT